MRFRDKNGPTLYPILKTAGFAGFFRRRAQFSLETLKIALNGRNLTFLLPLITGHFGALYRWTLPQASTSRMEALLCRVRFLLLDRGPGRGNNNALALK
jgi:hypothetical protein